MKSFAVTLLTWGALFALLWWGAHEIFYPPGDWIGAALVSFFGALGIGGLRKARIERRDANIVQRAIGAPADGQRVAIAGTIEPVEGELIAPLSGQACVIYDYEISHVPDQRRTDGTRPSPVIDKGGMAMAPVFIRSGVREIRLLAYPGIEDFEPSELGSDVVTRARDYIAATKFNDSFIGGLKQVSSLLDDRSGRVRADFKNTSHEDLSTSRFRERCVPAHAKVCVVGLYSAKENAILPQGNVGGTRLISGTREDALKSLKAGTLASMIIAGFFLVLPGPVVFGVLTIRENYFEKHGEPSVLSERTAALHAAVAEGDAPAVQRFLRRGVMIDAPNASGIPALSLARNAEVATMLLDAGATVDKPDKWGYTPVMLQSRDGRVDVVRLLVAHRANISQPDPTTKMNALDIALTNGQDAVAAVLREAGARASH